MTALPLPPPRAQDPDAAAGRAATGGAGGTGGTGIRLRRPLVPSRADLVDLLMAAVLAGIGLVSFRTGYVGWSWWLAAAAGLALGLLVAQVTTALRLPAVVTLLALAAAYLLLGGPLAVRDHLVGGVLPTGRTLTDLATVIVTGWKRFLTLLPPVESVGPLVALPFAVGLVAGATTLTVARRWSSPYAVVLAPLLLLALGIALGTLEPASLLLQGVGFALAAIGWMVLRAARQRAALHNGAGRGSRAAVGAGLLAVAALCAWVAGPHLPGGADTPRRVVRSALTPPFDVAQYPSPLAGFRLYTEPNEARLWDREILSVRGVPAGTPLRFGTLDSYDSTVWGSANRASTGERSAGTAFQQVGPQVAPRGPGREVELTVRVPEGGYSDVWLPTVGAVTGVDFAGPRAAALRGQLWLNVDTSTALVPARLRPGDSYTMRAVLPSTRMALPRDLDPASGSLVDDADLGFLDARIDAMSRGRETPWEQLVAVAGAMRTAGAYTDGGTPNSYEVYYLPGHGLGRLARFVGTTQLAGNDEQYAATLALVGNRLGIPTRVVMGAITPAGGVVRGKDVRAWVEVRDASGAWVAIPPDAFVPDRTKKPNRLQTRTEEQKVGANVPPPAALAPPSTLQGPEQAQNAVNHKPRRTVLDPSTWPWWLRVLVLGILLPLLLLVAAYWSLRGLKAWQRRRRSTRGPTASRVAAAWDEVVGSARSHGIAVPARATRLEQAAAVDAATLAPRAAPDDRTPAAAPGMASASPRVGGPAWVAGAGAGVVPLARAGDAHVFGPGDPTLDEAAAYWAAAMRVRRQLRRSRPLWRRLWADVDPRPLLRAAARRLPRPAARPRIGGGGAVRPRRAA